MSTHTHTRENLVRNSLKNSPGQTPDKTGLSSISIDYFTVGWRTSSCTSHMQISSWNSRARTARARNPKWWQRRRQNIGETQSGNDTIVKANPFRSFVDSFRQTLPSLETYRIVVHPSLKRLVYAMRAIYNWWWWRCGTDSRSGSLARCRTPMETNWKGMALRKKYSQLSRSQRSWKLRDTTITRISVKVRNLRFATVHKLTIYTRNVIEILSFSHIIFDRTKMSIKNYR